MGVGMISRRQLMAGLLASAFAPRLPAPATAYVMFEPIPLERIGEWVTGEWRGDRIDPYAPLLPFTTWPGDPRALDRG